MLIFFADVSTFADSMLRHKVAAQAHTRQYQSKHHHEHHYSGPFFEGPLNTSAGALNIGVHLYTEGVFDCRVGMLKDKTVSKFCSMRDAHLLMKTTSHRYIYLLCIRFEFSVVMAMTSRYHARWNEQFRWFMNGRNNWFSVSEFIVSAAWK